MLPLSNILVPRLSLLGVITYLQQKVRTILGSLGALVATDVLFELDGANDDPLEWQVVGF